MDCEVCSTYVDQSLPVSSGIHVISTDGGDQALLNCPIKLMLLALEFQSVLLEAVSTVCVSAVNIVREYKPQID